MNKTPLSLLVLIVCIASLLVAANLSPTAAAPAVPLSASSVLPEQVARLVASDAEDGDGFGASAAISGDTLVVGAPYEDGDGTDRGAAYIFQRDQGGPDNWGQVARLAAAAPADEDRFGYSVGISDDTVVVGAAYADAGGSDRGAAYIFQRDQGGPDNWGQVVSLTTADAADDDCLGYSAGISGDTVVVGAFREDGAGTDRGAAYVFQRDQGGQDAWGQVAKLTADDAADADYFGWSAGISGDTLVVGAPHADGVGSNRGAAYIFQRDQGGPDAWGQLARLVAEDPDDGDRFGAAVAISGDTAAVGVPGANGVGSDRGAAYVYQRDGGDPDAWGRVARLGADDAADEDYFGQSVAISGDVVVVGAPYADGAGGNCGAAYLFERDQGGANFWGQLARLAAGDADNDDLLGGSAAISGDTSLVGAHLVDAGGSDRGAAYVFMPPPQLVYLPLVVRAP